MNDEGYLSRRNFFSFGVMIIKSEKSHMDYIGTAFDLSRRTHRILSSDFIGKKLKVSKNSLDCLSNSISAVYWKEYLSNSILYLLFKTLLASAKLELLYFLIDSRCSVHPFFR
jgi:hypothetical protein